MSKIKDPKKIKYFEGLAKKVDKGWELPKTALDVLNRSKGIKFHNNISKIVITGDSRAEQAQNILGWCKKEIEHGGVEIVYLEEK